MGLGSDLPRFSEVLPEQRLAFPPRQLTTEDLTAIDKGFEVASRFYPRPALDDPGKALPLSAATPVPFLVTEARPDGWMHIDGTHFGSYFVGWLHADLELSGRFRAHFPELDFLEGAVGYLSYLQARDGRFLDSDRAAGIARRANEMLARYTQRSRVTEKGESSATLADVLRTAMVVDDSHQAAAMLPTLFTAVQNSLPDSRLRDILGMTRLAACCRALPRQVDPLHRAARLVGLSGALNDFLSALTIDPGNVRAVANLNAIYEVLVKVAFPVAAQAPENASASLREAYDRALTHLPTTRDELDARQTEIKTLLRASAAQGRGPACEDSNCSPPPPPPPSLSTTHWLTSDIYKADVYDNAENKIGVVNDLIVDNSGNVTTAVIGVGGFLGAGKKEVAVPFQDLKVVSRDNKYWLVLNQTKEQLKAAPAYSATPESSQ
jgi:sporulation protein YlmC with PRC-barrel domain